MKTLTAWKILLVQPLGYRAESEGKDISRVANIMPPIGLASIAAYLKKGMWKQRSSIAMPSLSRISLFATTW